MNACTIIAKNYVAYARVLARSFLEHHPGGRFWTLIIDDFAGYIDPAQEPFEVLTPSDIGCEPFTQMALAYTVLELSTAVKPWLLRHLMGETGGPVTYLDPDIKVYGSLQRLDELAGAHGVVLTPHNAVPIPQDGRRPSQVDIMIAGVYNLGYVSVAPRGEVDRLLDWWSDRLRRDCRVDPVWGYFVDQRWFDLAPGFLTDIAIVRDPEYNVAYWNLHSRTLSFEDGRYEVDGRPLAFFHFSGFDASRPLALSRYQDRIDVVGNDVLERLLADYAGEVNRSGHPRSRTWSYSYGALGDGSELQDTARTAYGALYEDFVTARGAPAAEGSPFTPTGAEAFKTWLTGQAPSAPTGVSRLLARIYEDREDLRGVFPDWGGPDRPALLEWAQEYGSHEIPLLAVSPANGNGATVSSNGQSAETAEQEQPPSAPLREGPWGVNVVGYFRSEVGTGEAARQVIRALEAKGVPTLPIHGQTIPLSRQGHTYVTAAPEDAWFPVNLICMNADMLPEFSDQVGPQFFAGRYSIGLWFWEVSRLPEQLAGSFSLLEEVWAPTAHVAAALQPLATVPVSTVRIPVSAPAVGSRTRAELGLPEGKWLYLYSFDYFSVFQRKNPLAVIEAFRRAFAPGEGAALVIKCINQEHDPKSHAQLQAAAAMHPDVTVVDRYFSPADNVTLTALCDSYVSLHRAEGFGLVMAEAMALGKPVIATGYSGNLDFMTTDNSLLVDHRMVPIGSDAGPYPAEGEWAEPDVDQAAGFMRRLFDDQDAAHELGRTAAREIRRTHSPDTAGEIMLRRLESIRATGRVRRAADPVRHGRRSLSTLSLHLRLGPVGAKAQRARAAREMARQGVLRVMRPFTAYQETVNHQVLAALEELSSDITEMRSEAQAERVRLVAEVRGSDPRIVEGQAGSFEEIKRMLTFQTDRGLYLAVSELGHRHAAIASRPAPPAEQENRAITPFELRAFSQNGEDGALAEILRRIGASTRFFVEFGVESGREGNCVYLADVAGWRGLFMEADEDMYAMLERKYSGQPGVRTIQAEVSAANVEELFARAEVPPEPDVLSIDVDGQDYWIWRAVEAYRPRVVIIEYNSAIDPRRRLVQPPEAAGGWEGTDYFGASLGALRSLGEEKGYRLVHTELSGVNAFFVRADLAGEAFPEPDDVAVRGAPNYFQAGHRHPAAAGDAPRYLDLDAEA